MEVLSEIRYLPFKKPFVLSMAEITCYVLLSANLLREKNPGRFFESQDSSAEHCREDVGVDGKLVRSKTVIKRIEA